MKVVQPGGELTLAYEALRAQARGEVAAVTPRGLALFLAAGFPGWMKAWVPLAPAEPKASAAPHRQEPPVGLSGQVVQLLTEMALGCQRKGTS
ncbi:MAG TPA: hypothetical protein VIP78_15470 [Candidatus Dormibacteraeota bacterium]